MFYNLQIHSFYLRNLNELFIMSTKRKNPNNAENTSKKLKTTSNHWSLGLLGSLEDPELKVLSDDLVTVIKDKYPKSEFHYLVIPKENINSLKEVNSTHVNILKHMHSVAENLSEEPRHKGRKFLIGYHAEPSMTRLHLHLLSDDMNSPSLKTKKHWNSFTTAFFLDSKSKRFVF